MFQERPVVSQGLSLPEVNQSVSTEHQSLWRRFFAFAGPAYLVSVGYMDPGNWATDLEGGARFGYKLVWVLLMSNAMALLLQTLSSRLGIVTGHDLAQACRTEYPKTVSMILWVLCELAIIACDLAEVLGAAIGLNLLFHIPLMIGVLITAADTLLILWLTRVGIRVVEAFVLVLIGTIGLCFAIEIFFAKPSWPAVLTGVIPTIDKDSLYVAVGILGATVMPHNLYLHSALVQTRRIGKSIEDKKRACRWNFIDTAVALNGALFVNAAILILAAAVFYKNGIVVTEIQQAHRLLSPMLGTTVASALFGAALLCAGQSSTLTGTMAGQIVMEGFLHFHMQPWLRRAITRTLAIVPAALTIYYMGEEGSYRLLILSQVVLSIQLPFAVIPLVYLTSDRRRMGEFANKGIVVWMAAACAVLIVSLNLQLAWQQIGEWITQSGDHRTLVATICISGGLFLLGTLAIVTILPLVRKHEFSQRVALAVSADTAPPVLPARYETILVTLDHSESDRQAIANAMTLAKTHNAQLTLLHIEEGLASQVYGSMASTAEVTEGRAYLEELVELFRRAGLTATLEIRYGRSPAREIAAAVRKLNPDLVIMAAHGHGGLKDLIFGTTINSVRHKVSPPLLVISPKRPA